jgi:hypothetical protein
MVVSAIVPVLSRLRQEDGKFEPSLVYITRPYLKKQSKKPTTTKKTNTNKQPPPHTHTHTLPPPYLLSLSRVQREINGLIQGRTA